ncbi:hypothetical protein [Nocardia sp. NPDC050710]|uniref:hypothetical protein n=1 Tax=Nocardia sp. NPDC050710 TaxID=3157220 RepID=UPI0033F96806
MTLRLDDHKVYARKPVSDHRSAQCAADGFERQRGHQFAQRQISRSSTETARSRAVAEQHVTDLVGDDV